MNFFLTEIEILENYLDAVMISKTLSMNYHNMGIIILIEIDTCAKTCNNLFDSNDLREKITQ